MPENLSLQSSALQPTKWRCWLWVLVVGLVLVCTGSAKAQQPVSSALFEGARISLHHAPPMALTLLGDDVALENNERLVFLSVDLQPGWKTYWRLPGRFGFSPHFDISASINIAHMRPMLPAPWLFDEGDGTSIGYDRPTLWPLIVRTIDAGQPSMLNLSLNLGLCQALCIPETANLAIDLPVAATRQAASLELSKILALRGTLAQNRLSEDDLVITVQDNQTLRIALATPLDDESFFVLEGEGDRHRLVAPDRQADSLADTLSVSWPHDAPPTALVEIHPGQSIVRYALR